MSHGSYNNIKKYAAFIFMVFTVLSGSSERIDSESYARLGRKAFIDILASGKLFIQDAKASSRESDLRLTTKDQEGFRGLLDVDAAVSSIRSIQLCILILTVSGLFINNSIEKNNIWKSAVF